LNSSLVTHKTHTPRPRKRLGFLCGCNVERIPAATADSE